MRGEKKQKNKQKFQKFHLKKSLKINENVRLHLSDLVNCGVRAGTQMKNILQRKLNIYPTELVQIRIQCKGGEDENTRRRMKNQKNDMSRTFSLNEIKP